MVIGLWLAPQSPSAAAVLTATHDTFATALNSASAGDTIALQGHFEKKLAIISRHFETVTIDAGKATLANGIQISSSSGLNITGGQWRHHSSQMHTVTIIKSHNISLANASFSAAEAGDIGHAVYTTLSSNITIRDNSFDKIHTAILVGSNTDSLITRNRITNASSDGINVADSHRMVISNNYCGGTAITPGAHPDCIQLWSLIGKPPKSSIFILNNVAEGATQGFTSFNPGDFSGQDIVIAGNLGTLSYPQGIACYGCRNSQFLDNTLITLPGSPYLAMVRVPQGVDNYFKNNRTFDFRSGTMADVMAVAHVFSDYKPTLKVGATFQFDSRIDPVPEPVVWLQLIVGFALIGVASRRFH